VPPVYPVTPPPSRQRCEDLAMDHEDVDAVGRAVGRLVAQGPDVHARAAHPLVDEVAAHGKRAAEAEPPRLAAGVVAAARVRHDLQPGFFIPLQLRRRLVEDRLAVRRQIGSPGGKRNGTDAALDGR